LGADVLRLAGRSSSLKKPMPLAGWALRDARHSADDAALTEPDSLGATGGFWLCVNWCFSASRSKSKSHQANVAG